MKRARVAVPAALLLALGAAVAVRAHQAPKTGRLQASGTVEARDVRVGSLVGGRVESVAVDEGARVKRGDVLVTLETRLLDPTLREQRERIGEMRARLALVRKGPRREELARARADWENAEADRIRFEALFAKGILSSQQRHAARTAAETRRQLLAELENGSRAEEIAAAEAALLREESRLAYLERQREEAVVRASADGVLQSLDLRPGDLVAAGQPVATLLEPSEVWVRVFVPETRIGLVSIGSPVAIGVDSFPGRVFPARVVEIGSRAEYTPRNVQTLDQRSDTVFAVKLAIEPSPELKPGMAALATFGGPR